jgi:hypothetical protein
MTTTMTSAQFAWNQFSAAHIQREGGAHELADDREDRFDVPVPITASKASKTSTTSTTSTKSKRIQFSTTGHLIDTNNRNKLTAATAATTATVSPAAPAAGFEQVKKAKTRSERRAEEPEVEPEAEEPVARKERRSDYWVQRDDLRRDNARTMKNQFQDFEE